jgi:ATP-dependent Clp protease ATP-binding subunit ClpA
MHSSKPRRIAGQQAPHRLIYLHGHHRVGKTELARSLAAYLFNDENAMVRIDMSEYRKTAVSASLRTSCYVGYDEGGQLTEKI